jgi:hypothetical protein
MYAVVIVVVAVIAGGAAVLGYVAYLTSESESERRNLKHQS